MYLEECGKSFKSLFFLLLFFALPPPHLVNLSFLGGRRRTLLEASTLFLLVRSTSAVGAEAGPRRPRRHY